MVEHTALLQILTSISIDAVELQTIKDAYTDLTNFYINEGIAENINFGVVSYDSSGRFHPDAGGDRNLTADEALVALQNLTIDTGIGTRYYEGLNQADQFLLNSRYNPFFTTGIGYFFTDGQNTQINGGRFDMLLKARDVRELANFQAIAYYSNLDTLTSNSLEIRDVNWIDSNQGVFLDDISDLSTELLKSDLADDVVEVNILLDGEIVDTITPDQLTDSPLGLTYEGSVEGLDISIDAENIITAEVVFTPESNLATTNVDYTVTAGEGEAVDGDGNAIAQSGNEDPFETILNGSDSDDEITLGYVDLGANGSAGSDKIVGNKRSNNLDGGAGNDRIFAHGGNDTIITGAGEDRVDSGEGIDTVVYDDKLYADSTIRKVGNIVSVDSTDSLTDVEFIQYSDFRISTETLAVTPILEADAEITIAEGDSGNTTASFTFNLSTPAPVDVQFTYNTVDGDAVAGEDYIATSGQAIIAAGETSTTVEVEIIGDTEEESTEVFALSLSEISGATFANNETEFAVVANIENDDVSTPTNNPPVLVSPIGTQTVAEDSNLSLAIAENFQDNDLEDILTYTATLANGSELPSWLSFDGSTQTFSGIPTNDDVGSLNVLVTATDTEGETASDTFELTVENVNDAPILASEIPDLIATEDEPFEYTIAEDTFSDIDPEDSLTYTATLANGSNLPGWLNFDSATRTFIGTPLDEDVGTLSLLVTATDNENATASDTFNLKVVNVGDSLSDTRINANGGNYTDVLGQQWLGELQGFSSVSKYSTQAAIAETEDAPLYQGEFYRNNFTYTTAVENGVYDVTLKFAEVYFNKPNQRVFDVSLEDQLVLDDFDIFAEAGGKNIALDKSFTVEVIDKTINLDFAASVNNAKISAIEIEPSNLTPTIRINASTKDYADTLGRQWLAEPGGFSRVSQYSNQAEIAQTEDDLLYQSEFYRNNFTYTTVVEDGVYDVTLKFAEIYFDRANQRVFDVSLEDQLVLDDFDIFAEAGGKNIALDKTFTVEVTDGAIDLDFAASVNNAKLSAIEIQPSLFQELSTNATGNVYTDELRQQFVGDSGF